MKKLILSLLVVNCVAWSSTALARCWSTSHIRYKEGTTATTDSLVQRVLIHELDTTPAQYELIFEDSDDRSRTLILCSLRKDLPYCQIEDDGGGFYFDSLDKRVIMIKTTGRPIISEYDDETSSPAFTGDQEITFQLRKVREGLCK
jgi:hypothetical protein